MPKTKLQKNTVPNLILLGDPAAGKATHGAFLAKKFGLYDFDMGRELRAVAQNPKLRKKYKLDKTLEQGKLTPTKVVRQILKDKIFSVPKTQGLLLNGTPKMLGEAKLVSKWLKDCGRDNAVFVYLSIPFAEIVKRMTQRKEYFKGKFSKRPDDNKKALENRIKYYNDNISFVVKYFKKLYPFADISTLGSIPQARKRILTGLNILLK